MEWIDNHIFLIPLMPLIGAIVSIFFGKKMSEKTAGIFASALVFVSFLLSVTAFLRLREIAAHHVEHPQIFNHLMSWIHVGVFKADWAFRVDPLSSIMILVVSGVGFLIHVYSIGYMHGDPKFSRYFAYLNLFTFSMLVLVLASNVFLMFIGWEGVGLCSYLLIGFWFEDINNARAGLKAFVVNRIGDFSFIIGALLLFWWLGQNTGTWSIDFYEINEAAHMLPTGVAIAVCVLLFGGAVGKSAQIPLHVWLPDAMAGPTPVSALIHAATMVTAGVYMIARFSGLYLSAPAAMDIVATVGVMTALFSATIAVTQNDIKKVLAYSTVSQLGFMFLGVGVGAFAAGIFHLMTHAFFKGLLFLGAGSVIHGMHGEQDMRKMGGLKFKMPITFVTFMVAWYAICGLPGGAGFFSKDEILWKTFESGHTLLWVAGVVAAALTAFYMTRLIILTFYGEKRWDDGVHPHESPKSMTVPLVILAVLSAVGGLVGIPHIFHARNYIHDWLEPSFSWLKGHGAANAAHVTDVARAAGRGSPSMEWTLMFASITIAGVAAAVGWWMYSRRRDIPEGAMKKYPNAHRWVLNKYYVDELYDWLVIKNLLRLTRISKWFDDNIVDGLVNGSGRVTVLATRITGWIDNTFVDGAVNLVAWIIEEIGERSRVIQTGRVQQYLAMAAGIVVLTVTVWIMSGALM